METMTVVETTSKVQTYVDRMVERGTCMNCDTPINQLKKRTIWGHDIYVCPDCGCETTTRYTKSTVVDPDKKRMINWVV